MSSTDPTVAIMERLREKARKYEAEQARKKLYEEPKNEPPKLLAKGRRKSRRNLN